MLWQRILVALTYALAGWIAKHAHVNSKAAYYIASAAVAGIGWFIHNPPQFLLNHPTNPTPPAPQAAQPTTKVN